MMKTKGEDGRPMMLIMEGCHAFIRTIPTLVADQKRLEDLDTEGEDHVYDEARYCATCEYVENPERLVSVHEGDLNADRAYENLDRDKEYDPLNWGL
jgi:hypothetical protein